MIGRRMWNKILQSGHQFLAGKQEELETVRIPFMAKNCTKYLSQFSS